MKDSLWTEIAFVAKILPGIATLGKSSTMAGLSISPAPVSTITKNFKIGWILLVCAYVCGRVWMDDEDAVSLQPTDDQSHSFIDVFRHYLENQIYMLYIT